MAPFAAAGFVNLLILNKTVHAATFILLDLLLTCRSDTQLYKAQPLQIFPSNVLTVGKVIPKID